MTYTYPYPHPALTVDIVLFRAGEPGPEVLLIQRRHPPYADCWALPGGFVDQDEPLEAAARRELFEETHLADMDIRQLAAFGEPGRDPRGWTVSVAYWGWVNQGAIAARAGDDAAQAVWWPVEALPPLAFDHAKILRVACQAADISTLAAPPSQRVKEISP